MQNTSRVVYKFSKDIGFSFLILSSLIIIYITVPYSYILLYSLDITCTRYNLLYTLAVYHNIPRRYALMP